MTSGDVGALILVTLNGLGFDVPAGSTGVLLAAPGYPTVGATEEPLTPVTFSIDGSTAFYYTQGNGIDFQSGGNWTVKVQVNTPTGQQFTSPPGQFYVYAP
jgi:hypothetical protein